jgi:DNA polymerase III epsilon subunit-like protein
VLALGIDLETQGLDKVNPYITEVGAILFDTDKKRSDGTWVQDDGDSWLCYEPEYPPQSEYIIKLTGITDDSLKIHGKPRKVVLETRLAPLMEKADIIFIHNKSFDEEILKRTSEIVGVELPWKEVICTKADFPWREDLTCNKLQHLAYEHRIFWKYNINPDNLHRAADDIYVMMLLVQEYPLEEVLAYARAPKVNLVADVHHPKVDGGVQNKIAGSLGFRWHPEKKIWWQNVREAKVEAITNNVLKSASPFRVSVKEII